MPDFNDLISQAKKMQEKMKETHEILKKIEVEGISGGNAVKVIMNGDGELKKITFDDALFKESKEILEDLIFLSLKKKEIQLKYDLEHNVNLIKFSAGKIDISYNDNLDKNFVRNLSEKLYEWTGNRWLITLEKTKGQKTFAELQDIKRKKFLDQEKEGEIYKKFKNIFSDGELLEVKKED